MVPVNPYTLAGRQSTRWCFTINNPSEEDQVKLDVLSVTAKYLVYGREQGRGGTFHYQGFVVFRTNQRLNAAKRLIGDRAHLEIARGTSQQASDYCKKDGDFSEFGEIPLQGPKNSQYDSFKEWVLACPNKPTLSEIAHNWGDFLLKRGTDSVLTHVELIYPRTLSLPPNIVLREWQQELIDEIKNPADPRMIKFVIDRVGNEGKSFLCRYILNEYPDETQFLSVGRRQDLSYAIDESKKIYLFDIPRSQSEYLQYSVLESLKDGIVFSTKYASRTKILTYAPVHVIVFMNEYPDMEKLSIDRYSIKVLGNLFNEA